MTEEPNPRIITTAPFIISKVTILPEDVVGCPLGDVLFVGFSGMTAYAWVKHHPDEQGVMNLVTLPSGGPFTLQVAEGFKQPVHVGSFGKQGKVALSKNNEQGVLTVWHVFAWHPIQGSATYSDLPSIAIN